MYLISEDSRPFAIIENATNKRIETAIAEEFSYKNILLESLTLPDWGDLVVVSFKGIGQDEGDKVDGEIEIIRLVNY